RPSILRSLAEVAESGELHDAVELTGVPIPDRRLTAPEGLWFVRLSRGGYLIDTGPDSGIYWMPAAVAVWWDAHDRFESPLGLPTSHPQVGHDGLVQSFEHGSIQSPGDSLDTWASGVEVELEVVVDRSD